MLVAESHDGKLAPAAAQYLITGRKDIHYPKPHVVSVTQPTELGTLYSVDEVAGASAVARRHGLRLHMDGLRLANAIAAPESRRVKSRGRLV